jgi:TonB family protein
MKLLLACAVFCAIGAVVLGPGLFGQGSLAEYTGEARLAGLEGRVIIECVIGKDGVAHGLRVQQSLGLGLDEKAMEAVTQSMLQGNPLTARVPVDFVLPMKQSRWHLIGVAFSPPQGVTRPIFLTANYPTGPGISLRAFDEGRLIGAIGRQAMVKLSFDVDDHGNPVNFQVQKSSYDVWGGEAIALVSHWQFKPGTKNGVPVAVPVTLDLAWGSRDLSPTALETLKLALSEPGPAVTLRPVPIFNPLPPYTEEARKAGLEGTVVISLIVGIDGSPKNLLVIKPLGMGLDDSAIQTVSTWRFQPSILNGNPAEIPTTVEVNFRLP